MRNVHQTDLCGACHAGICRLGPNSNRDSAQNDGNDDGHDGSHSSHDGSNNNDDDGSNGNSNQPFHTGIEAMFQQTMELF